MTIAIEGIPPLDWTHGAGRAEAVPTGFALTAEAGTDWFIDPAGDGGGAARAATSLSFDPGEEDFQLVARVGVDSPRTTFDAAVITLWAGESHWAKLCFEQSPQGQAMVVSVVTNEYSDDANGPVIDESAVWLRVSRMGTAFAFHYSMDGNRWHFVRLFRLHTPAPVVVGFMAQAPFGELARATFEDVSFERRTLEDVRDET